MPGVKCVQAMGNQSIRSLHGCWTCRLRRKKCDEHQPSCSTCIGLRLMCYGYGSRPDWMDGGPLEKQQATRVKQIVKENSRNRLRRSSQATPSSPTKSLPENIHPALEIPKVDSIPDITSLTTVSDTDNTQVNHKLLGSTGFEGTDEAHNSLDVSNVGLYPTDLPNFEGLSFDTHDLFNDHSDGSLASASSLISDPTIWEPSHQIYSSFPEIFHPRTTIPIPYRAARFNQNFDEASLFMLYLDHVFYIHFPFYDSSAGGGRGWLYNLMMRDDSIYHAALALSQHYRSPTNDYKEHGFATPRYGNKYYIWALQELQEVIGKAHTWTGPGGITQSVHALACSLHLLVFEIASGASEAWQMHMRASASLLPQIVKLLHSPQHTGSQNRWEGDGELSFENQNAVSFLIASFIWFDVFACASTGADPFLDLDHVFLLESNEFYLENLMGCENWVVVIIFRISELGRWKKEAEGKNRLSIAELAKRGGEIENTLREMASQNDKALQSTKDGSRSRTSAITRIFALATLTYLHVIVSGANPHLPEIADSVSTTLVAFQALADPADLQHLRWPLCISACLALGKQQEEYRKLCTIVQKNELEQAPGLCTQAYKVVEECWNLRAVGAGNCDWIVAMNRLGYLIFLV